MSPEELLLVLAIRSYLSADLSPSPSPLLPCQTGIGLLMGVKRALPAFGNVAIASVLGSRH